MVDINKLNEMLRSKGVSIRCPICQQNSFTGIDTLGAIPTYDDQKNSVNIGNPLGMAIMTCNNCHYVMMFNAKAIGLP